MPSVEQEELESRDHQREDAPEFVGALSRLLMMDESNCVRPLPPPVGLLRERKGQAGQEGTGGFGPRILDPFGMHFYDKDLSPTSRAILRNGLRWGFSGFDSRVLEFIQRERNEET